MSILNDKDILKLQEEYHILEPFYPEKIRNGVVSYGLSGFGYDITLSDEFMVMDQYRTGLILDPKNPPNLDRFKKRANSLWLEPGAFVLGVSKEWFNVPDHIFALVFAKSSYARYGMMANFCPIEGGWSGNYTLAFFNSSPNKMKIYANEGIAQVVFFEKEGASTYTGKYNNSEGITLGKVE